MSKTAAVFTWGWEHDRAACRRKSRNHRWGCIDRGFSTLFNEFRDKEQGEKMSEGHIHTRTPTASRQPFLPPESGRQTPELALGGWGLCTESSCVFESFSGEGSVPSGVEATSGCGSDTSSGTRAGPGCGEDSADSVGCSSVDLFPFRPKSRSRSVFFCLRLSRCGNDLIAVESPSRWCFPGSSGLPESGPVRGCRFGGRRLCFFFFDAGEATR